MNSTAPAPRPIRLDFTCPETVRVDGLALLPLIQAGYAGDAALLGAMRAEYPGDARPFDHFVAGLRGLAAGDLAAAARRFGQAETGAWRIAASILRSIALAGCGDLSQAIETANRAYDLADRPGPNASKDILADRALIAAGLQCLAAADAQYPTATDPIDMEPAVRYVISYPRSGNTMLREFFGFAFDAPPYSVYPGDGRYFSRRFYQRAPGHVVFVKDHDWRDEYAADETLYIVRDGRDAVLSYARFLYAEGSHQFVRQGELADFLPYVAAQMSFGFWSDHVRTVLAARDRGARVRLLRYEEIFGNYPRLMALARDIAQGGPAPRDDEPAYRAEVAANGRAQRARSWASNIPLPADSYLPQDWTIGGGTIDWRRAFDAPARRRFHELGGTEMLIRLGYESDENWWRNG